MVDDEVYYLLWDRARHLSFRWGAKGKVLCVVASRLYELGFPERGESPPKYTELLARLTHKSRSRSAEQPRDGSGTSWNVGNLKLATCALDTTPDLRISSSGEEFSSIQGSSLLILLRADTLYLSRMRTVPFHFARPRRRQLRRP